MTASFLPPSLSAPLLSLPVFPLLWLPHCTIMLLTLRATLGPTALTLARRSPLSCYLLGLAYTFAGALTSLVLRGKPLLGLLALSPQLYSFTVVWYLMLYFPGDTVYKSLTLLPVAPLLAAAQDWMRILAVKNGVSSCLQDYPGSFLVPVVFASLTSSGFMLVKYLEQVLQTGDFTFKIRHPSSKTMVVAALLLTAQHLGHLPGISPDDLYCCLVLYAVAVRLLTSFVIKVS